MDNSLDLSDLPISAAERQLGYLIREPLGRGLGCLILQGAGRVVVMDPLPLLLKLSGEDAATFLLEVGLSEDEAVDLLLLIEQGRSQGPLQEDG